ncbi:hypothetical protein ACWD4V_20470 [Streptomyces tsukubensis]
MMQLEPDVAFGAYPEFGVVAEAADERSFLVEVLRRHWFAYNDRLRLGRIPAGTRFKTALWLVATTAREFQGVKLSPTAVTAELAGGCGAAVRPG